MAAVLRSAVGVLMSGSLLAAQAPAPRESASARMAAVRFALANGLPIPTRNLVVLQDTALGVVDGGPVRQSASQITRETEEIAKQLGRDVQIGWQVKFLECLDPSRAVCWAKTNTPVLVVSGLYEGQTPGVNIRVYLPGPRESEPRAESSVTMAAVRLERRESGWIGVRYSYGPTTSVRPR